MTQRRANYLLSALVMAFALCGCGGGSDSSFKNLLGTAPTEDPFGQNGNSALSFTPITTDFGVLRTMSSSSPLTITVKNDSSSAVYLASLETSSNPNFSIASTTCSLSPALLASGRTCDIVVVFNPQTTGVLQWTLAITFGTTPGTSDYTSLTGVKGTGATNVTFAGIDSIDQVKAASVRLRWTDVAGEAGFMIFKLNSMTSALEYVGSTVSGVTEYTATGLTPNTAYSFRVKALDLFGQLDSNLKNVSVTTLLAPVLTAQSSQLMASLAGALVVGQTYAYDFDNVAVMPSTDSGITYSCYYDTTINGAVLPVTNCSTLAGLTLDPSFSTNGRLAWTPDTSQGGKGFEILIRGDDGSLTADRVFGVNVRDPYVRSNLAFEVSASFANNGIPGINSPLTTTWQNLYYFGGNGLNGTLTGTFGSAWAGDGTDQTNPYRIVFDGVSGGSAGRVTLTNPIVTSGNYGFSTWLKPTNISSGTDGYIFYNGGISVNGWSIRQGATGEINWDFGASSNYETIVMSQAPTLFYKFEETGGAVIADGSANGNNGVMQNPAGATFSGAGHDGLSTNFANNAYVSVGPINFAAMNPQYTVSVWVKTPLLTNGQWKTVMRGNGGDHQMIFNNSTNEFGSYFNTGGFFGSGVFANALTSGWHLFTVAQSNSGTSWYVDGVFANSIPNKSTTDLYAVGNYQGGGQGAGDIDGFAFWLRALSANEISAQASTKCSVSLAQGSWAHLSGIYNGTTVQLFKNGSQVCQAVPQAAVSNSGISPSLGARPNGMNAWSGEMADFRIHTALSSTDISTSYNATKSRFLTGPASIGSLAFWVDAKDVNDTGVPTANGTAVATWKDKSGNNSDLLAVGTTPTLVTNGLGVGLPAMYFAGAGAHNSNVAISGPYTIAMVSRLEGSQNARVLGDYTGQNMLFGYWSGKMHGFYLNGSPENLFSSTTPAAINAANTKNSYIFTRAGSSGTFTFYNNGALYATNGSSTASTFKLQVGCGGTGTLNECSKVYISELIVFSKALTPTEVATLNSYLATRWGF